MRRSLRTLAIVGLMLGCTSHRFADDSMQAQGEADAYSPTVQTIQVMTDSSASGRAAGRGGLGGAIGSVDANLDKDSELLVIAQEAAPTAPGRAATPGFARLRGTARRDESRPARPERRITQGTLTTRDSVGGVGTDFPLRHTDVRAEISGYLARTIVEQTYENPAETAIEAVYTFPLPSMGAVNDFVMEAGGRKIVGVVRPREEAERIYADARARGHTASLLTQERPNIFTQSVANIEAQGTVKIRITYVERLSYEHGEYSWVFPMVVGPRYVGGKPQVVARHTSLSDQLERSREPGTGWARPTDRVPDADRVTPPVLPPGTRSGHDISLAVDIDAGMPITRLTVPTHRVERQRLEGGQTRITLARGDSIPNRDFVLRWRVDGDDLRFGTLAHRDGNGGYFTLAMQPPREPSDEQVMPREITFILDVSGSMFGLPLEISKELVRRSLAELREDDRFNLFYFASGNGQLWPEARPRNADNVAEARRFLDAMKGGGGTEMMAGLQRAMAARHDPSFLQMYVFLTDGFIAEDDAILRLVKEGRGDARFFAFGIGSSVNRNLIDGVGQHGGGTSHVILPRDEAHADRAVRVLFDAIDSPVLVDVAIEWNGLPVRDVYPSALRDLFAGQTINVIGRYTGAASGTAYVTGRIGSRRVRYPVQVELPDYEERHAALAATWARHRIQDLSADMLSADEGEQESLRGEIVRLAIEHRLMSQYTSFVAVDESRVVGDGRPARVVQPVELPEGVDYEHIFGERPRGTPVRIEGWGVSLLETEAGSVRVAEVKGGGVAARAGLRRGAAIKSIGGARVRTLADLERLLLQAGVSNVRIVLDPGGTVALARP